MHPVADGLRAAPRAIAALETRLSEGLTDQFIRARIRPLLADASGSAAQTKAVSAQIVQNIGTGRATVRYQVGDDYAIFAKLYSDDAGAHSYGVLSTLWERGFGEGEKYQIPKPLSYWPAERLLLVRGAQGRTLSSYIAADEAAVIQGAKEAARWLAKLHDADVRIGREADPSGDLLHLSSRLIKTAAQQPREAERLLQLTQDLRRLAGSIPENRHVVQVHGRFNHDHLLLGRDTVTVIDWDRSRPADAALDLAEFLHALRSAIFKRTGEPARLEPPTTAFLEEYVSRMPDGAGNLAFYWAFSILFTLARAFRQPLGHDLNVDAKLRFYLNEFEQVTSGAVFTYGQARRFSAIRRRHRLRA